MALTKFATSSSNFILPMNTLRQSFITLAVLALLFSSCGGKSQWQRLEGATWNTVYHIVYESDKTLNDSIFAIFGTVDNTLSVFNDRSLVARLNNNETTLVNLHFSRVFTTSQRISNASGGAFDPTVGPLVDLWGFGRRDGALPDSLITSAILDSVRALVGIGQCYLKADSLVKKSPLTRFNFSAIAKGYGCDLIADMFRRNGVNNYLIEIGGELALGGYSHRNRDWIIQIDAPVDDDSGTHNGLLKISASDCGIATSGNYRNNHTLPSGLRVGHTISTKTGRPVSSEILSATIIAHDTMEADALATACMAMPLSEAIAMIENLKGVHALFVLPPDTQTSARWGVIFSNDEWQAIASPSFPTPVD